MGQQGRGESYLGVLAVRDFRYLWIAEVLSVGGDQLTRVALSVLVFARTDSAAITGLTYGLTFLPTLLGSLFLAGFADHYPRRTVMFVCNLARAILVGLVVVPGMPLWLLCVLVAGSSMFLGPFKAAEQALIPDLLAGRQYILGMSLRTVSSQIAQLAGFAVGGTMVFFLTPVGGLLFDAGTFVVAAFLVLATTPRPARPREGERALSGRGLTRGFTAMARDKRLLVLAAVLALNLFHIVPEGMAAPFVEQLREGTWAVALIQAAAPLGAALGAFVFGRLVPESKHPQLLGPAAVGASVALIPVFLPLGLWVSVVLFAIAGALSSIYTMYAVALIAQLSPEQDRARVIGVNTAILQTANGLGPMLAGLVAGVVVTGTSIAIAGVVSAAIALVITVAWARAYRSSPLPEPAASDHN
ncbi:MFS transporter [Sciscionella sediminilitoris]|uniref:MFS transporter n=1 Tax=Sciscionella sediminilitoris TaxID=1445613 RepID=UPI0004DF3A65|nr:MFS transporter [Sciscionella sp. SE31]